jgi:hypothetical protein
MRPAVPEHSRYTPEDLLTFYKNPRFVDHRHSDAFAQVADRVGAYVEVTSPAASTGLHPFLLVGAGTPRTWTRPLRRGSAWWDGPRDLGRTDQPTPKPGQPARRHKPQDPRRERAVYRIGCGRREGSPRRDFTSDCRKFRNK